MLTPADQRGTNSLFGVPLAESTRPTAAQFAMQQFGASVRACSAGPVLARDSGFDRVSRKQAPWPWETTMCTLGTNGLRAAGAHRPRRVRRSKRRRLGFGHREQAGATRGWEQLPPTREACQLGGRRAPRRERDISGPSFVDASDFGETPQMKRTPPQKTNNLEKLPF